MCDVERYVTNEIPRLKDVDSLLRCGICYEYMKTSMMTACSHNYCSLCIRKSLLYKSQCPACFEEAYDHQLRNNRIIDDIIEIFLKFSDDIKTFFQEYRKLSKPQIKLNTLSKNEVFQNSSLVLHSEVHEAVNKEKINTFQTKSHAMSSHGNLSDSFDNPTTSSYVPKLERISKTEFMQLNVDSDFVGPQSVTKSDILVNNTRKTSKCELQIPSIFSPNRKHKSNEVTSDTLVPCPVCSVDIPENNINIHLDACLKRAEEPVQNRSPTKAQKRRPLPKLVYSLLQEKDLRKKIKEHGLSTHGDRKALMSRHQRFTLLYNSECDTLNPRSTVDIIKQIEREEQEEKKACATATVSNKLKIDRKTNPKLIEEAQHQYIQQNKSSFEALIQSVRQREEGKKTSVMQNFVISDDEDVFADVATKSVNKSPVQKAVRKKITTNVNRIPSDDEESFVNKSDVSVESSVHTSPVKKAQLLNNDESNLSGVNNLDDTFDMNFENSSNGDLSPVLGNNTTVACSRRENEKQLNFTPDMFQRNSSESGFGEEVQKINSSGLPSNVLTANDEAEKNSDAGSNQSFSLLADYAQEISSKCEDQNITTKIDEGPLSRKMFKRIDSQLEDPDFEPYTESMSDDFEVETFFSKRRRNTTRKSSNEMSSTNTEERRVLRKRVKR